MKPWHCGQQIVLEQMRLRNAAAQYQFEFL